MCYDEKISVSKADVLTVEHQLFFFLYHLLFSKLLVSQFSFLNNTMTSRTDVSILDLKSADDVMSLSS